METYLVGGAVRDKLLDLPGGDRDWVVVGTTPDEMLARGFTRVGKDFPVFLHPDTKEEYALARTERKTAPGYTGFEFHAAPDVTLEQDLERRDLTINAMAMGSDNNIIDPFNGQEDLANGKLRHVSPAFAEDPVRILRVARFAARFGRWGFRVAHGTNALMRKMVESGEVDALVPERVWAETCKALGEDNPERFIEVLRGCGALAVIFPEIDRLFGIPQPHQHHPEVDTGEHIKLVLKQAVLLSTDPRIRFAALVHDLGKGTTPEEVLPKHIAHEARGVKLIEALCDRLRIPNDYRELAILASKFHTHIHLALELKPSTIVKVIEDTDALRRPERFEQLLTVCTADARGRLGSEDDDYPQADLFRQAFEACAAVDTKAVIKEGMQGPQIAEALHQARVKAVKNLKAI